MTQTATSTRTQIDRTNAAFSAAFQRGDGAAAVAVYTADGQILPPNSEPRRGKHEIQAFWQGVMDSGVAAVDLETVEFTELGQTGWEMGIGTLKGKNGHVLDVVKFIVIWQQENGAWKWHRDIWNSNRSG